MIRTQVLLEEGQYRWLKALAARTGKSLGRILREILEERKKASKSKRKEDPFFRLVGSIRDKPDVAERHDDYLYGEA